VDDLSSALDLDTEATLLDRMLDARADGSRPTCLAVSHRRPILGRADHILVLENGRVTGEGTAAELLGTSGEFRRLWQAEDSEGATR
jgi:ATP-binding cassette subfamily B protein